MAFGKHWLLRASVGANLFAILYLALYYTGTPKLQTSPESSFAPFMLRNNEPNLYSLDNSLKGDGKDGQYPPIPDRIIKGQALSSEKQASSQMRGDLVNEVEGMMNVENEETLAISHLNVQSNHIHLQYKGGPEYGGRNVLQRAPQLAGSIINPNFPSKERQKAFPCSDMIPTTFYGLRSDHWILYNYVIADKFFLCDETVTYTTHGEFTFLDNLIPLLQRWAGPVSLSIYSPGSDFYEALKRVRYLRKCDPNSHLVREYVTFHFILKSNISQMDIPKHPMDTEVDCTQTVQYGEDLPTFKKAHKLSYPINIARNVAKEMAMSYFVLASDIELYPNPNLINDFLVMVTTNNSYVKRKKPRVFVLSIFEVEKKIPALPYNKTELLQMLDKSQAIPFHKFVCPNCHRIPMAEQWRKEPVKPGLHVFHVGKRVKPFEHWEPIYIGSKLDPFYDERLTWEGRGDKMTQGYILCSLDYEFHILDNGFLVHKPGIKKNKVSINKSPAVRKQNALIAKVIRPELIALYGKKNDCYI